jgi:flagellar assembly protein FliH
MRMAAPTKFMFDTDFTGGPRKPVEPVITIAEHTVKLAEAETASQKRGYAQGRNDAQVEVDRRIAATLDTIAQSMAAASAALQRIEARLECEAVEVAVAVARKLAPTLVAREPFAEISALASDCFRQLSAAPHIVVRVNDAVYSTAKEKLEEIARAKSFEGRLVVLAEPDIALGDCRIEWADGGINRDSATTEAVIGEAVAGYVGALGNLAGPPLRRVAKKPAPQATIEPVQAPEEPPPVVAETPQTPPATVEVPEAPPVMTESNAPPTAPEQPDPPRARGHELLMPTEDEFRRA